MNDDPKFDELADSIGMRYMFTRTTFVHHPAPAAATADDGDGDENEDGDGDEDGDMDGDGSDPAIAAAAAAAIAAAAAAAVVGAAAATPEPTVVTLIPCVGNNNAREGGVGSTVTRLKLPGCAPVEWPPPQPPRVFSSSDDDDDHDDDNDHDGRHGHDDDHYRDVVLVVAGEWLSKITKGVYPAPAVSHGRWTGASDNLPCLHVTYRA